MAKKAAKTNSFTSDASTAGAAPKKASVARTQKHLKAQASGVVAAVEGFVSAITNTSHEEKISEAPVFEAVTEVPVAAPAPKAAAPKEATEEEIRILAYTLYLNRPAEGGSEAEDWLRAEQTLRSR